MGRGSKWGNPFQIGKAGLVLKYIKPEFRGQIKNDRANSFVYSREQAIEAFKYSVLRGQLTFDEEDVRHELRGKNLACWCSPNELCHADILLEIANEMEFNYE